MSGVPGSRKCKRQPVIFRRFSSRTKVFSVASFPDDRTFAISSERFALVKMSAMGSVSFLGRRSGLQGPDSN
jgi:hypothetical protein